MTANATGDGETVLGEGHVALVTGSTDSIGAAAARDLAETGATVVVHGRDSEKGKRLVADLPGEGHAVYTADFTRTVDSLCTYANGSLRSPFWDESRCCPRRATARLSAVWRTKRERSKR